MIIISIDNGSLDSAFVVADCSDKIVVAGAKVKNAILLDLLGIIKPDLIVIEELKSYGMPFGQSLIDTCYVIGMVQQLANSNSIPYNMLCRKAIVTAVCGMPTANDSKVRAAMLDIWGKDTTKGFKADMWSALAVLTAWLDLNPLQAQRWGYTPGVRYTRGEGMRTDSLFVDIINSAIPA